MQATKLNAKLRYEFSGKLWASGGQGGWYFISLPAPISEEIRAHLKWQEEGWGRMKAAAAVRSTQWETAIWFDKKLKTYLLPIKSEIRSKANLQKDETYDLTVWI